MKTTGPGLEDVESAIKLIAAAKQAGVQHLKLGDFEVMFASDSVLPQYIKGASAPQSASALDDPDLWLHVQPK